MSYLKLRELWDECEKLDRSVFKIFVDGLSEIHDNKWANVQAAKPCVAQQKRTVCNRGRWEPQEDDLLRQCVSMSRNPHQGFVAFACDVMNKKRRTKDAAQQRYYDLMNGRDS